MTMQPNDLPIVCLPLQLSDKHAATMLQFLHDLIAAFERHYGDKIHRYYQADDERQAVRFHIRPQTDPPF